MNFHCAICNEPWDCRGTHFSNSDLDEIDFLYLLNGYGCPCCAANGVRLTLERNYEPNEEYISQWRSDVDRVSEGLHSFFDGDPFQVQVDVYRRNNPQAPVTRAIDFVETQGDLPFTYAEIGGK